MKRVFLMMLAICTLAGCSKDNGDETPKNIEITGGKTTQEVFADNTQGKEGVRFTTTGAWTSSIAATTKAEVPDWVSIDPASGDKAGDYTINIILTPNYTGENRKAEIKISCGGTVITITVEQKGLTESGEKPKPQRVVSRIVNVGTHPTDFDNNFTNTIDFTYDNQDRVESITMDNRVSNGTGNTSNKIVYTYESKKIIGKDPKTNEIDMTYMLNDEGYISSAVIMGEYEEAEESVVVPRKSINELTKAGTIKSETNHTATYSNGYLSKVSSVTKFKDRTYTTAWDYTWENGNLMSGQMVETYGGGSGKETVKYEYGSQKDTKPSNLDLSTMGRYDGLANNMGAILGLCGKRTANLPIKITTTSINPNSGTDEGRTVIDTYSYEFNAECYISRITNMDGNGGKYTLELTYR